jgi:transcriptional regulator with XRE-family HTH domain
MTDQGPGPLAEAVKQRRLELGLAQGELAGKGGPSLVTVREIEKGRMRSPQGLTLSRLDKALDWPSGTAARAARGLPVAPVADTARPVGLGLDDEAEGLTAEQIESVRAVIRAMKPPEGA